MPSKTNGPTLEWEGKRWRLTSPNLERGPDGSLWVLPLDDVRTHYREILQVFSGGLWLDVVEGMAGTMHGARNDLLKNVFLAGLEWDEITQGAKRVQE